MNDELRHANNYKYIKREWKNGKWQYTYEDSKGVKGKSSANPLGVRDLRNKSGKTNIQKKKLVEITNRIGYNGWKGRKEYKNVYALGTGDRGISGQDKKGFNMIENADGTTKKIKTSGRVRKDGPDDQNAAAKATKEYKDIQEAKKNSKSAMQTSKTDLSKARPEKVKTANQKPARPVKNEKSLVDVAKEKLSKASDSAKKSMAKGSDWIKDKLGYDEKERYEQKTKEKKALEEIRKTTKQELAMLKVVNVPGEAGEKIDKIKAAHEKSIAVADKLIENAKRETKKAKEEYSKTVVGVVDKGTDWLKKKLGLK